MHLRRQRPETANINFPTRELHIYLRNNKSDRIKGLPLRQTYNRPRMQWHSQPGRFLPDLTKPRKKNENERNRNKLNALAFNFPAEPCRGGSFHHLSRNGPEAIGKSDLRYLPVKHMLPLSLSRPTAGESWRETCVSLPGLCVCFCRWRRGDGGKVQEKGVSRADRCAAQTNRPVLVVLGWMVVMKKKTKRFLQTHRCWHDSIAVWTSSTCGLEGFHERAGSDGDRYQRRSTPVRTS